MEGARLVGLTALRGRQRDRAEAEARADDVDGGANPLVAIEERELLEHAQVRELNAEQADRQRPRPRYLEPETAWLDPFSEASLALPEDRGEPADRG